MRQRSSLMRCSTVSLWVLAWAGTAAATPLDPESCGQLKGQRDALQANGLRELVSQRPAGPVAPERLKQVRQLITLDGQLRFRCGIDLLLPTLKPDPVDEFVDAGDNAGSGRPNPRAAAKKTNVAKARSPAGVQASKEAPPQGAGTPVPIAPRTATVTTSSTSEPQEAATKSPAKSRQKVEDAYRAPSGGDPNGTPLNKQQPKAQ